MKRRFIGRICLCVLTLVMVGMAGIDVSAESRPNALVESEITITGTTCSSIDVKVVITAGPAGSGSSPVSSQDLHAYRNLIVQDINSTNIFSKPLQIPPYEGTEVHNVHLEGNLEPGKRYYLRCGTALQSVTLPQHELTHQEAKAPTCAEIGWEDYYKCSLCGKFFEDEACTKEIPNLDAWKSGDGKRDQLPHTYGEWTVVTPATEAAEGLEKRVCSVCGHEETRAIPKPDHVHKAAPVTGQAPTCTADGWKDFYKCACGRFFEDEACTKEIPNLDAWKNGDGKLAKLPHTYGEWTVVTPATETEEGLEKRVCSVCGHEETRVIPKLEHIHKAAPVTGQAPTCTADGWKDFYKCACGKFFEDEACTKEIPNLDAWKNGDGKLAKLPHTYGEWTVVTPATETEEGLEKRVCSVCGHEETRVLPKLNHTHAFGDSWKHDEANHWHECSCGEKADLAAHDFEWIIDKEATGTTAGAKHQHCTVCGYNGPSVEIPAGSTPADPDKPDPEKPGKPDKPAAPAIIPQTGDSSHLMLWALLSVTSLGGAATVLTLKKKHGTR